MKKISFIKSTTFLLFFVISICPQLIWSQGELEKEPEEGITYDSATGNYIIRYYGFTTEDLVTAIYEPPTKIKPSVKATVEFKDGTYTYSYEVFNGKESIQNLDEFGIECKVSLSEIVNPPGWMDGWYAYVPVFSWTEVEADVLGPQAGIHHGSSTSGFSFKAKGLPSIVNSYFVGLVVHYEECFDEEGNSYPGSWESGIPFPDEPPEWVEEELKPIYRFPNEAVKGKTIGPVAPPEVFEPLSFLDNLISLKEQAYSLGWIDNKGILNSLNQKLEAAKKNIEKGKIETAKNILGAFINEVEAQKEKHLSSEAYALLKFNAQYLIENL